jgi:S-adenosylmethionine:tRNA ribosyltransferase-isomerase
MRISDYDYQLPEERIAQFPPEVRGQTRLLVLNKKTGEMEHRSYSDLADYLSAGDLVVLNDTKVIKARLIATNTKGQPRELLLIESHGPQNPHNRTAIYRGKISKSEILKIANTKIKIEAILDGGLAKISSEANLLDLAEKYGNVPLPPYMKRQATKEDQKRYQTTFAKDDGSVAAPTASLNFTPELAQKLESKGVIVVYLTLHVGLGTFLPIRTDNVEEHTMHSEYFEIPTETVRAIKNAKRVCAVGTTVARTLEYSASKILKSDDALSGEADIFMYPGYQFKLVDVLLTNFHAPRSTVLMLTAAFAGWENLQKAYQEALAKQYDFLSYGDSMLVY